MVALFFLVGFAAVYFYCGRSTGNKPFATISSLVFLGLGVLALILAICYYSSVWSTPAPYYWFIVAFFGFLGVKMEKSN